MSIKFVFFQNRLYLIAADIQSSVLVAVTQWALQTSAAFDSSKITMCQMLLKEVTVPLSNLKLVPKAEVRLLTSDIAFTHVLFLFNCWLPFKMFHSITFLMEL